MVELLSVRGAEDAALRAEVLALRRQVQVLERRIKRIRWAPGDRMMLAALNPRLPKASWPGLLVKPETVLGWHRELIRRRWAAYSGRPRRGRPPLGDDVRALIVRMAKENPSWGYVRIRGELLKLGHGVAATSIRAVLIRAKVPPAGRRGALSWKRFLAAHAQSLIATDFLIVDTIFFKRLYVLFFLHLGTRRLVAAISSAEPNQAWVTQQARNLTMQLQDDKLELKYVTHDRDRKYCRGFDAVLRAEGAEVIVTPLLAPTANAHAERWVGSLRRECLDRLLIVSERQLAVVLHEYLTHYNSERPHRSCGLRPPTARGDPALALTDAVLRKVRLGGLLSDYRYALGQPDTFLNPTARPSYAPDSC